MSTKKNPSITEVLGKPGSAQLYPFKGTRNIAISGHGLFQVRITSQGATTADTVDAVVDLRPLLAWAFDLSSRSMERSMREVLEERGGGPPEVVKHIQFHRGSDNLVEAATLFESPK